jgi:hypothetical protein
MARAACVALFLMLLPGIRPAEACKCQSQAPPCAEYWKAAAIFRGRVDAVTRSHDSTGDPLNSRLVTFSVLESLKGVESRPTIEVRTAGSNAACGFSFVAGREYVVYAWSEPDGRLATGRCSRTRPIDEAHADLSYARSVGAGGTALGRISGRVVLRTRDLSRARDREQPMPGIDVMLRRGEILVSARTGATGMFAVEGLEAGSYTASLDLPGSFNVEMTPKRVELPDARGCAVADAVVHPDGRVTGRAIESDGRAIEGLTVDLTVSNGLDEAGSVAGAERLRTVTRRDGSYEFSGVPPGRFVVGINTRPDPGTRAQPRVLHPGVLRVADAATVRLNAGERIDIGNFAVPASAGMARIIGVVFDSSGAPAEGARVYLRGPAERDYILTEPVVTDFVGRFTIAAFLDYDYLVFAERDRPGDARGRLDLSEPVLLTLAPSTSPLRLTLRRP